jgi:hypothetical protein
MNDLAARVERDAPEAVPAAIEAVFAKLLLVYGTARVLAAYRGQDVEVVKRHWGHELRGVTASDVAYGLTVLPPDQVPNVLQFRAACMRAPVSMMQRLARPEAPAPSPERIKAVQARLAAAARHLKGQPLGDPKAWAWKLKAQHEGGEAIPSAHVRMYREALGQQ